MTADTPKSQSVPVLAAVLVVGILVAYLIWRDYQSPFNRCVRQSMATYQTTEAQAIGLCSSLANK